MTFVEFFDNDPIRNVSSALLYSPERVVLVGKHAKLCERYAKRYRRLFEKRKEKAAKENTAADTVVPEDADGCNVTFECKCPSDQSLQSYVNLLTDIVETYDDCVFDVDGGDRLMMIAFGIVYERFPQKNIQLHQLNYIQMKDRDCDRDGVALKGHAVNLSVEEVIRLHGGDVVVGGVEDENTYHWEMTEGFTKDIDEMWSYCRDHIKAWNIQAGVFQAATTVGHMSEDGCTVHADLMSMESWLAEKDWEFDVKFDMIHHLENKKLISDFHISSHTLSVTFKDQQVKRCLTKGGLLFEMKVFSVTRSLKNDDGTPMYDDAVNGVVIDWDGALHDEEKDHVYDTENEIDVMLMHSITPIFISCKTGFIDAEELYKLQTVARRFGGTRAKMVLAAVKIESNYIRQRLVDMGIYLIEGVNKMTPEKMDKVFKKLWAKTVNDNKPNEKKNA